MLVEDFCVRWLESVPRRLSRCRSRGNPDTTRTFEECADSGSFAHTDGGTRRAYALEHDRL
jgi:hypothetical protein